MERETSADLPGVDRVSSALVDHQTQKLAPAVAIRRPPHPRRSVIPVDPVPTDSAAEIVPIKRMKIPIAIHI
jgi:hypothetical protein